MKTFLNLDAPISTLLEPNTVFFIRPRCEDVRQAAGIINKLREDGVGLVFRCDVDQDVVFVLLLSLHHASHARDDACHRDRGGGEYVRHEDGHLPPGR